MKLTLQGYSFILFIQFLFMFLDLGINSFSYLARGNKMSIISIFIAQDVSIVLSFGILVFTMYSTYVYQAGLADLIFTKFRTPLAVLTLYFILSVSHHIWIVLDHHKTPHSFQWPMALTALFITQRLFSPFYYYLYKRSALRISDPRFYENLDWVTDHLAIK